MQEEEKEDGTLWRSKRFKLIPNKVFFVSRRKSQEIGSRLTHNLLGNSCCKMKSFLQVTIVEK